MQIRQAVITDKRQAEVQTRELTVQLAPEEALIESECSFISAGTELAIYTSLDKDTVTPGKWCTYPWDAGYANVGIVRQVGSAVTRVKVGERVFTTGPHATMFIYNVEKRLAITVPAEISSQTAAASRMAGVAASCLASIRTQIYNPTVLVFGLGMVGNFAAQILQNIGATVVAIDPIKERRELAAKCGILHSIPGGIVSAIKSQLQDLHLTGTNLDGVADIVVDATGVTPVTLQAFDLVASNGQLILLGSPRQRVDGNLTELLSNIHLRNINVSGALEWSLPTYPSNPCNDQTNMILPLLSLYSKQSLLFRWIIEKRLHVDTVISHELAGDDIKIAYEGLLTEPNIYTGVILKWK